MDLTCQKYLPYFTKHLFDENLLLSNFFVCFIDSQLTKYNAIFFLFDKISGMILRPHRRHMGSDLFEKTMILKSNYYRDDDHMANASMLYDQI